MAQGVNVKIVTITKAQTSPGIYKPKLVFYKPKLVLKDSSSNMTCEFCSIFYNKLTNLYHQDLNIDKKAIGNELNGPLVDVIYLSGPNVHGFPRR